MVEAQYYDIPAFNAIDGNIWQRQEENLPSSGHASWAAAATTLVEYSNDVVKLSQRRVALMRMVFFDLPRLASRGCASLVR
jgi:hypothetical protein